MKLPLERLSAHLERGVDPLYVLSGDEPLLAEEALLAIREAAARSGYDARELHVAERGFDWDAFAAGLQNFSLFASRRLVELRLPAGKPGDSGARFLAQLAAAPDAGNVIVIVLPALDSATAKSKWAMSLAQAAVWVELRAPQPEQLLGWLATRARRAGVDLDEEAREALAARVEGNLLAAKQEIDKLALLRPDGKVGAAEIRDAVADGARFDVFQLSDAALAGDAPRALRVLQGLQREGVAEVLVLWSLVRDILPLAHIVMRAAAGVHIDRLLEEAHLWRSRRELFRRAARGRTPAEALRLVAAAARTDQILKGARRGVAWNALTELTLELARTGPRRAEIL